MTGKQQPTKDQPDQDQPVPTPVEEPDDAEKARDEAWKNRLRATEPNTGDDAAPE